MELIINGKKMALDYKTAFEVREHIGNHTDIVILNGFQIEENFELKERDQLTIIRKGIIPKREELESMMMSRHTPYVHEKLKKGKVAIAGLGGLGSNIAIMLARIGVGFEPDLVKLSGENKDALASGFGLFVIETLMDSVEIVSKKGVGTSITMVKNLPSEIPTLVPFPHRSLSTKIQDTVEKLYGGFALQKNLSI